ncbi:MAG: hypothetical protein ABI697_05230 [Devosia sp.]
MTTINRSMYPVQTSMNLISRMQQQFATLQTQLGTGQKASSLAEMGTDRYQDLTLRARLGRIEGYQNNMTMVGVRLDLLNKVMGQFDTSESDARSGIAAGAYGSSNINFGTAPTTAQSRLDEVLTLLNTDVDGRYLFGGSKTDKPPVGTMSTILDGVNGKAGFKQVASERLAADTGDGLGRLTLSSATNTATLKEDGIHPFGFKLSTVTASNLSSVTPMVTSGPPKQFDVAFATQPQDGDTISIGLTLPDGTSSTVVLTATTGTPGAGQFQVGADTTGTATNFTAALQGSLTALGQTDLAVASNYAAADNFFNGQGQTQMRVAGPNFATATSLAAADPTTTVAWYSGADSAAPRSAVSSKIDDNSTVNYGVQANESGTLALVKSLATLSIQNFSTSDSTSGARFDAVAARNGQRLSETHNSEDGSIELVTVQLGTAQATVNNVKTQQTAYKAQLESMLSDIETIPAEDVTMQLLALQTRLQASYQTTSMIANLSLVNYLK